MRKLKYEEYKNLYRTRKIALKSVVKKDEYLEIINKAVINVNKIVIHTYNILKYYYIYNFTKYNKTIEINLSLLRNITKLICKKDKRGRGLTAENELVIQDLEEFYNQNYKKIMLDDITLTHLSNVIEYELIGMITGIKNHIINNFYDFLNRYINIITNKKKNEETIINNKNISYKEKQQQINTLRNELKVIKHDIFNKTMKCDKKYYNIYNKIKNMLPRMSDSTTPIKFLYKDPLAYMPMLVKMSIEIENIGTTTINCFPLRKNIIPKHITIDTASIIYMCSMKNMQHYIKNISLLGDDIWVRFFRTERKIFSHKHYVFANQITTDGISCSILLIDGKYKGEKIAHTKQPISFKEEQYIDEIDGNTRKRLSSYQIIGIDPNKDDLIYATNGEKIDGKYNTFRYTQNQRRKELKIKKYRNIINNDKIKNNVIKQETKLSDVNSKSCILSNIKKYMRIKTKINSIVSKVYEKELYRKLKRNVYINRKRSEDNMLNNFKKRFDTQNNRTVICIGDFEQRKQMKYKEPTKGKSFRKLFRNAGYEVYLVDEYKTSQMSFFTQTENEKFRVRGNPRPWMNGLRTFHGLLRSKNVTNNKSTEQHILVNRDLNASLNIRLKAQCAIKGINIPKYMSRPQ